MRGRRQRSAAAIDFYFDGNLYETQTPATATGRTWEFDRPFFILLNVAVGGQWPGSPNSSTTFPQTMTVDYVRVCQKQVGSYPRSGCRYAMSGFEKAKPCNQSTPALTTASRSAIDSIPAAITRVFIAPRRAVISATISAWAGL